MKLEVNMNDQNIVIGKMPAECLICFLWTSLICGMYQLSNFQNSTLINVDSVISHFLG